MKFLTELITRKLPDAPGEFALYRDFVVEFEHGGQCYRQIVPKTFITDFASVPRLAQLLPGFSVNGASAPAAVVHDFHYCCRGRLTVTDLAGELARLELTRQQCDRLLYDGLLACGYSRPVAAMFYGAVRAGGWLYWYRRRDGLRLDFDFLPLNHDWSNQ